MFSQAPESGTLYEKASDVVILISQGIKIPDIVGKEKTVAIEELESLGFVVLIYPDPDSTGKVLIQIPKADNYLNYGSEVSIELSIDDDPNGDEIE